MTSQFSTATCAASSGRRTVHEGAARFMTTSHGAVCRGPHWHAEVIWGGRAKKLDIYWGGQCKATRHGH
eukprot:764381-Pyramimonas_sp.AAC.1